MSAAICANLARRWKYLLPPLCSLFVVLFASHRVAAQPADQTDSTTRIADAQVNTQVRRFETLLDRQRWDESINTLRKLASTHLGDRVVAVECDGFTTTVSLNQHLQSLLFRFGESSPALDEFRSRVQIQAEEAFSRATERGDRTALRDLIDEFFATKIGDNALLTLGDIEAERGNYTLARSYWRRIHAELTDDVFKPKIVMTEVDTTDSITDSPQEVDNAVLQRDTADAIQHEWKSRYAYRGSEIPIADVRARLILASILEGNSNLALQQLHSFQELHPAATGRLAGQVVDLHGKLSELLRENSPKRIPSNWSTYRGNLQRNAALGHGISLLQKIDLSFEPDWHFDLPGSIESDARDSHSQESDSQDFESGNAANFATGLRGPSGSSPARTNDVCRFFPVVAGDLLLYCDETSIYARSLATGAPVSWSDLSTARIYPSYVSDEFDSLERPSTVDRRFTLTVVGDLALACLDALPTSNFPQRRQHGNQIVGVNLAEEGRLAFSPILSEADWEFAGTPIGERERIYVVMRRLTGVRRIAVVCYEGDRLQWKREFSNEQITAQVANSTNQMQEKAADKNVTLTFADECLYLNSNMGLVAAISPMEGRVLWTTHYGPSASNRANLLERPWFARRNPTPCVFHQGVVYFVPNDFDGMFALNACDGSLIWKTNFPDGSFDATHVLGVTSKHVVLGGRRLWWIKSSNGNLDHQIANNPLPRDRTARMVGMGQGVIAGRDVFWPCRSETDQIFVCDAINGQVSRQPKDLSIVDATVGNLMLVPRHLLLAGPNKVFAFSIDAAKLVEDR